MIIFPCITIYGTFNSIVFEPYLVMVFFIPTYFIHVRKTPFW